MMKQSIRHLLLFSLIATSMAVRFTVQDGDTSNNSASTVDISVVKSEDTKPETTNTTTGDDKSKKEEQQEKRDEKKKKNKEGEDAPPTENEPDHKKKKDDEHHHEKSKEQPPEATEGKKHRRKDEHNEPKIDDASEEEANTNDTKVDRHGKTLDRVKEKQDEAMNNIGGEDEEVTNYGPDSLTAMSSTRRRKKTKKRGGGRKHSSVKRNGPSGRRRHKTGRRQRGGSGGKNKKQRDGVHNSRNEYHEVSFPLMNKRAIEIVCRVGRSHVLICSLIAMNISLRFHGAEYDAAHNVSDNEVSASGLTSILSHSKFMLTNIYTLSYIPRSAVLSGKKK